MSISLKQVLDLVGQLDDSRGEDSPRERFRSFLKENVNEVGQIRDYVRDCLATSGDQYNRALQDLVNHIGRFLNFEVTFGRYRGIQGEIAFDGHWISPTGFHIVVEVKTTDVYAVNTAVLVGYVDELISKQEIPDWDHALGLYVIGRPAPEIRQLENAVIAEKRTNQLRIISVESLLSLAEIMTQYDVSHEDILGILRPSRPTIDPVVSLMASLVAQREVPEPEEEQMPTEELPTEAEPAYCWLTPVKSDEEQTAEEIVQTLVGQEGIYAFGERTPGRRHLKAGDWICFYATTNGVVAHAQATSSPENRRDPRVRDPEKYPWVFQLDDAELYLDDPVVIDASLRSELDAFEGRDLNKSWAWFVQATRRISQHDFNILTRRADQS